jgi:hypoxanthine phosphoribosyltransferase
MNSKILISEKEIKKKVVEIGKKIKNDYQDSQELILICLLKGSLVFAADLMREIDLKSVKIDFMIASSYGTKTESSKNVIIKKDLEESIEGADVIIVEDIIDSGHTLTHVMALLKDRKAKSIEIATILDKPSRREKKVNVKYKGFEIEDKFVVGYGLDFNQQYRNLKDIKIIEIT